MWLLPVPHALRKAHLPALLALRNCERQKKVLFLSRPWVPPARSGLEDALPGVSPSERLRRLEARVLELEQGLPPNHPQVRMPCPCPTPPRSHGLPFQRKGMVPCRAGLCSAARKGLAADLQRSYISTGLETLPYLYPILPTLPCPTYPTLPSALKLPACRLARRGCTCRESTRPARQTGPTTRRRLRPRCSGARKAACMLGRRSAHALGLHVHSQPVCSNRVC